jgi:hypothetical protein
VRVISFATSKNLMFKSAIYPHRIIHKQTCTSPDGITHNQTDHALRDKWQHSNILIVRCFRKADCDTSHYLVVAKLREGVSVSKRTRQNLDLESVDLKYLNDIEVKGKYHVEISNRFAALENLDESFENNNPWENIIENIETSAKGILGYQKL